MEDKDLQIDHKDLHLENAQTEETQLATQEAGDLVPTQEGGVLEGQVLDASEEEPVVEDRVFGMSRSRFHFIALGLAAGYILTGLLNMIGLDPPLTACVIGAGVAGYGLSVLWEKHKKKKQDAEEC